MNLKLCGNIGKVMVTRMSSLKSVSEARYFDSHAHIQMEPLWNSKEAISDQCRNANILKISVNSVCPGEDWSKVEQMSLENENVVIPSFGLHPFWINRFLTPSSGELFPPSCCSTSPHTCVSNLPASDMHEHLTNLEVELRAALEKYPLAGVGECGIDKRLVKQKLELQSTSLVVQKAFLDLHLALASEYYRPISIHCVGCWGAVFESVRSAASNSTRPYSIILHSCNSLSLEMAKAFSVYDFVYFSFSAGNLSDKVFDLLKYLPLDNILIESDSPDQKIKLEFVEDFFKDSLEDRDLLCNSVRNSSSNSPVLLPILSRILSSVKNMDNDDFANLTFRNASRALCLENRK